MCCCAVCGQMVVVSGPAVPCLLYWDMWVDSYFNPQCCQEYLREQTSAAVCVCVYLCAYINVLPVRMYMFAGMSRGKVEKDSASLCCRHSNINIELISIAVYQSQHL